MTPAEYCQNKAAKSGSSFYYSFLFLPEAQRQAITALYAFCREVDDVVDECKDPDVARAKLTWWRDEIRTTFSDSGKPNHPVCKALADVIKQFNLHQEYFLEIIDGMEMDLDQKRYATFSDLSLYCYRVASVVGLLAAEIFGYQNRQTLKYAHNLGIAFQLTNILRDIKEDASRGRIYLPGEELEKYGVTEQDFLNHQCGEQVRKLLDFQAQRALDYYHRAFELLPEEDRFSQRTGIIMATIYMKILEIIKADSCKVLNDRVSISPLQKLWLSWRSARTEKQRFKKLTTTSEFFQQQ
jgi:15-cis-phytoene synthase